MSMEVAKPKVGPLKCPSCSNFLVLHRHEDPIRYPFYYKCQNPKCKMRVGALPSGEALGTPASPVVRVARMEAHKAFDRLWQDTRKLPKGFKDTPTIKKTMRTRAYLYMGHALGIEDIHIGMMTDLKELERFTAVAKDATAKKVLAWWRAEGKNLYG